MKFSMNIEGAGMRNLLVAGCLCLLLPACTGGEARQDEQAEDTLEYTRLLQGVWLDDNTESPVFKIKGDSIYYASQINAPLKYDLKNDTLTIYGAETVHYPVERCQEQALQFRTPVGDVVSLHKSDSDSAFVALSVTEPEKKEVVSKDLAVMYQGKRYRGYVYINPTSIKVVRPSLTEEGLTIDNVYYDNVIHICVYQGRQRLYAKDITRQMFASVVPDDYLKMSILSDMDFIGVDAQGYHYLATLCIPDGASCYNVELTIGEDDQLTFSSADVE